MFNYWKRKEEEKRKASFSFSWSFLYLRKLSWGCGREERISTRRSLSLSLSEYRWMCRQELWQSTGEKDGRADQTTGWKMGGISMKGNNWVNSHFCLWSLRCSCVKTQCLHCSTLSSFCLVIFFPAQILWKLQGEENIKLQTTPHQIQRGHLTHKRSQHMAFCMLTLSENGLFLPLSSTNIPNLLGGESTEFSRSNGKVSADGVDDTGYMCGAMWRSVQGWSGLSKLQSSPSSSSACIWGVYCLGKKNNSQACNSCSSSEPVRIFTQLGDTDHHQHHQQQLSLSFKHPHSLSPSLCPSVYPSL